MKEQKETKNIRLSKSEEDSLLSIAKIVSNSSKWTKGIYLIIGTLSLGKRTVQIANDSNIPLRKRIDNIKEMVLIAQAIISSIDTQISMASPIIEELEGLLETQNETIGKITNKG